MCGWFTNQTNKQTKKQKMVELSAKAQEKLLWERALLLDLRFPEDCPFPKEIWNIIVSYLRFTSNGAEWRSKFSGLVKPRMKFWTESEDIRIPYGKLRREDVTMGLFCFLSYDSAAVLRNIDNLWLLSFCGSYDSEDADKCYIVRTPFNFNRADIDESVLRIVNDTILQERSRLPETLPLCYCRCKGENPITLRGDCS